MSKTTNTKKKLLFVSTRPDPADLNFINNLSTKLSQIESIEVLVTGKEAVHRCENGLADIIVIDNYVVDLNALDIVKLLRKINDKVFIIVLTSSNNPALIRSVLLAGATDFISKPVALGGLAWLIQSLIDNQNKVG